VRPGVWLCIELVAVDLALVGVTWFAGS
jgi:hypothetical protein